MQTIHEFVTAPPEGNMVIRKEYEAMYGNEVDLNILAYPIAIAAFMKLRGLTKVLIGLQEPHNNYFFIFDTVVWHLQIKIYQYALTLKSLGETWVDVNYIKRPLTQSQITRQMVSVNIKCGSELLLCKDLVRETLDEVSQLVWLIEQKKRDIKLLYKLSTHQLDELCVVCHDFGDLQTECTHKYCYECFAKLKSLKNECPVCRSVKKFNMTPNIDVNLMLIREFQATKIVA
ncbi:PlxyGVORF15-like protein [Hyphantria cunea granulovirus]|uniref:PlxyGVORF15-like protein n=1 Tax=Hyphantria cunea granulovirus TaxID=307448 RepID=A0AAE6D0H6_9BBAC|nr:PlxyGVORF15-like protein [Hyphantria cunea granulovirus]QBQ01564.1 PlxyGVORF15-like protein [Hyphantria cunea granulovirus]